MEARQTCAMQIPWFSASTCFKGMLANYSR